MSLQNSLCKTHHEDLEKADNGNMIFAGENIVNNTQSPNTQTKRIHEAECTCKLIYPCKAE